MARTISSGGRVCLRRDRIVGLKLLIRSGTVDSVAITRRLSKVCFAANVSRMKRTCWRRFLKLGRSSVKRSAIKITRTAEISGNMGTRLTSYGQRIFRDDTDNNYTPLTGLSCSSLTVKIRIDTRTTTNALATMTSTEMEQGDSGQQSVIKAVFLFFVAFALYFLTHSPALDDIDAVQFAMGVHSFDLWHHQPHPPGYPLFIFLGWLGTKLFHAGTESSLYFVSAFGGGLFVAAWFLIIRAQFSERFAWWIA